MHHEHGHGWHKPILWSCAALAIFSAASALWIAWYLLAPGAHAGDAEVYWSIGRAMLNNLVPYVDILDTKPPGIFLLSATSLSLFGSGLLGNILTSLAIIVLPILAAIFYGKQSATTQTERIVRATLAGVGTAFVLTYCILMSTPWQTELFCMLFAMPYVLLVGASSTKNKTHLILLGLTLFGATFFKEPFVLSCLAAAIFLAKKPKELLKTYVYPLLIAGVLWFAALTILAYLEPYFTTYLPFMLGYRASAGNALWQRGFEVVFMTKHLINRFPYLLVFFMTIGGATILAEQKYRTQLSRAWFTVTAVFSAAYLLFAAGSPFPADTDYALLGALMMMGGVCFFTWQRRKHLNGMTFLGLAALLFGAMLFVPPLRGEAYFISLSSLHIVLFGLTAAILARLATTMKQQKHLLLGAGLLLATAGFYMKSPFIGEISNLDKGLVLGLFAIAMTAATQIFHARKELFGITTKKTLAVLASVYLALLAVGIGGDYQPQHFLFMMPLTAALLVSFVRRPHADVRPVLAVGLMLLIGMWNVTAIIPSAADQELNRIDMELKQERARKLDETLTACKVDRYLDFGYAAPYGYTMHSPLNYYVFFGLRTMASEWMFTMNVRRLLEADIIVALRDSLSDEKNYSPDVLAYVQDHFSETPWPCAPPQTKDAPVVVLFRLQNVPK